MKEKLGEWKGRTDHELNMKGCMNDQNSGLWPQHERLYE